MADIPIQGTLSPNGDFMITRWPRRAGIGPVPATHTIYARPTGSDVVGTGTLGNPYKTFVRAMQDIPLFLNNDQFVVDITGIGQEILPDGYHLPPIQGGLFPFNDATPPHPLLTVRTGLTIFAAPTVLDTITTPTSQVLDPFTGLLTLTDTSKTWTPNQWKGAILLGANPASQIAVIASNTATTLEVCLNGTMTAPMTIVTQSAELRNSLGSSVTPAINMAGSTVMINWVGIKLTHANAVVAALFVDKCPYFRSMACDITGWQCFDATQSIHFGSRVTRFYLPNGGDHLNFNGLVDACTVFGNAGQSGGHWFGAVIFDGNVPVGHRLMNAVSTTARITNNFMYKRCVIRNGTSHGLQFFGNGRSVLDRVLVNNCAGSGIYAEGPGQLLATAAIQGSGNTRYGVEILDGSHVKLLDSAASTITGTLGDMKVGNRAVRTWSDFNTNAPLQNEFDIDPVTGTGSRLGIV